MFVKKVLTILFPLSGRNGQFKRVFDHLSLFHIELQYTNSLRAYVTETAGYD